MSLSSCCPLSTSGSSSSRAYRRSVPAAAITMELISLEMDDTGRVKLRCRVRKDTSVPRVRAAPSSPRRNQGATAPAKPARGEMPAMGVYPRAITAPTSASST